MDLGILDQHPSSKARPRVFCPFFSRQSALLIIPSRGSGNPETTLITSDLSTSNTLVHARCWLCHAISLVWHLLYQF